MKPRELPTGAQLDEILAGFVRQFMNGEATLEFLVRRFLTGKTRYPEDDEAWPPEWRNIWARTVDLWNLERSRLETGPAARKIGQNEAIANVWDAIFRAANGGPWRRGQHLQLRDIAQRLSMPTKQVEYMLEVQGWSFAGAGGTRACVTAVCQNCSRAVSADKVKDRLCLKCQTKLDQKHSSSAASSVGSPPRRKQS